MMYCASSWSLPRTLDRFEDYSRSLWLSATDGRHRNGISRSRAGQICAGESSARHERRGLECSFRHLSSSRELFEACYMINSVSSKIEACYFPTITIGPFV